MQRRAALKRMRAAALIGVFAVHGGMLYALAAVRIPTEQTEAKVLFVNIVESPEAGAGGASPTSPPSEARPRSRRAAKEAIAPIRPLPPQATPPHRAVEPPPDIASSTPATAPPAPPVTEPSAPTAPAEPNDSGDAGDVAGTEDTGTGRDGNGSGAGSASGRGGPVALTSELALVCPERRAPPYPSISRRLGESGRVVLRVELDPSGRVIDARVVDSSGFVRLDGAALTAVRTWRCTPPRREGQPTGAIALQPFDFTLDGP